MQDSRVSPLKNSLAKSASRHKTHTNKRELEPLCTEADALMDEPGRTQTLNYYENSVPHTLSTK